MGKPIYLKIISLFLLIAYLCGFAYLGSQRMDELAEDAAFVGVVQSLPERFHEPMNFYELEHLRKTLEAVDAGDSKSLGLDVAPILNSYLHGHVFNMPAVVALVNDAQLRTAKSELLELSARVAEVHQSDMTAARILFLLGLLGCLGFAGFVAFAFNKHLVSGDSATSEGGSQASMGDNSSALAIAVNEVSRLESVKSGHDYVLEVSGDELIGAADPKYPLIEAAVCELVKNGIVHGGRASSVRIAAGKPGTIKIFVGLLEKDGQLLVTVADDGEGIDEMNTIQHALAKGLVTEPTVKTLQEGHGIKLILLNGFSDAKANKRGALSSDCLAGVRTAVQEQGGSISLRNRPSVFCEFTLKLPV